MKGRGDTCMTTARESNGNTWILPDRLQRKRSYGGCARILALLPREALPISLSPALMNKQKGRVEFSLNYGHG